MLQNQQDLTRGYESLMRRVPGAAQVSRVVALRKCPQKIHDAIHPRKKPAENLTTATTGFPKIAPIRHRLRRKSDENPSRPRPLRHVVEATIGFTAADLSPFFSFVTHYDGRRKSAQNPAQNPAPFIFLAFSIFSPKSATNIFLILYGNPVVN